MTNNAPSTKSVIQQFMNMTESTQVYLVGGAAVDRYVNPQAQIMDYDIAIPDYEQYIKSVEALKNRGFDVGIPRIVHCFATVAKHKDYGIFDLSCMDIEKMGMYNIEKFYVEYSTNHPEGKAHDKHGAVRSLREGSISLISDPKEEKAYDLLRRFSVLAGKYSFSLERNGINKRTISQIEARLQETRIEKNNEHDRVRCLSRFLGAVLRSKDQRVFMSEMAQTGLLEYGFPQLNRTIRKKSFIANPEINNCKTKFDLVDIMLEGAADKEALFDELSILKKREADREEPKLMNKINNMLDEPASKRRIERLIHPVFAYINTKGHSAK